MCTLHTGVRACMIRIQVNEVTVPTSLLAALRHHGISSTMRRRIKHNGTCCINGQTASWKDFVHSGDIVTVELPLKNSFTPEKMELPIAYEDEYLLAVNKPAGLLMHPTSGSYEGTLANGIAYYYEQTGQQCAFHPMHRLDRNTSGLVLLAKQPQIQHAFEHRHLYYKRLYMALASHAFPAPFATVRSPISRCADSIILRQVAPGGKAAHTDFTRLAYNDEYSLLVVMLHTGRTHQIRVHSSYLGYPLLGDDLYGGTKDLLSRQGLHAYSILFTHPVSGKLITVKTPLPHDMQELIVKAGWETLVSDFLGGMTYAISNNHGNV